VTRAAALALLLESAAGAAHAQATPAAAADGGAAPDGGVTPDEAEIARALQADTAAEKAKQTQAAKMPEPAPAPSSSPGFGAALGRAFQSLNPDISAIVDFTGGWFSDDDGTIKSGDDPQSTGFKVQEIELALSAVVDPYFRADIFLTIPDLAGVEVEEAFLTTTHLPGNFQLKAGIFRAGLGRQNTQHLHMQDFTRRPALNPELLGVDGLRAPGLEVNWLVPRIPFYLLLSASAFSVGAAGVDQPLQTFGGGQRWDFAYVASARAFFALAEATSLYVGLNYAHGKTSQSTSRNDIIPSTSAGNTIYDNFYDNLYGADLYLKWKPPNQAQTYASVAWQTEYFLRHIPDLAIAGAHHAQLEGGLYTQVVVQTHRRWYLGLRGELMGIPSGDNIKREYAGAGSVTWALSEFSRVRLYGELRYGPRFLPTEAMRGGPRLSGAAFLQLEASIGAHGAHPF
jgi:hypothetical protein